MKKILLTTIATTALSSTAIADMMDSTFYFRGDILSTQFEKVAFETFKFKEKMNGSLDFGLGYNIEDNIRAEIVYTHMFPIVFKRCAGPVHNAYIKAYADSVILRGIIDIADFEFTKIFAGGGAGISRIRHSLTMDYAPQKFNSRLKYNIAANILVGASVELSNSSIMEIGYLYANYGKTKGMKTSIQEGQIGLRSHNIFLGLRYEL